MMIIMNTVPLRSGQPVECCLQLPSLQYPTILLTPCLQLVFPPPFPLHHSSFSDYARISHNISEKAEYSILANGGEPPFDVEFLEDRFKGPHVSSWCTFFLASFSRTTSRRHQSYCFRDTLCTRSQQRTEKLRQSARTSLISVSWRILQFFHIFSRLVTALFAIPIAVDITT